MRHADTTEMEWSTTENGDTEFSRKEVGAAAGGDQLGCNLYEIPAGKRSWPYHYHTANEEALFVLAGEGTVRCDGEEAQISEGDYLNFPADSSGGHRVINDSDGPLRYLMVSTMTEPDVTVYPDSEKFGVYVGSPPGAARNAIWRATKSRMRTSTTGKTRRNCGPAYSTGCTSSICSITVATGSVTPTRRAASATGSRTIPSSTVSWYSANVVNREAVSSMTVPTLTSDGI